MQDTIEHVDKIKEIKSAAAKRYGQEITEEDRAEKGIQPLECWQFKKCDLEPEGAEGGSSWYRLNVWNTHDGGIMNSHSLFDLNSDLSKDDIKVKLAGLEAAREYFVDSAYEKERISKARRPLLGIIACLCLIIIAITFFAVLGYYP